MSAMNTGDAAVTLTTQDKPSGAEILDELRRIVETILGAEGVDNTVEITKGTRLLTDLGLESVDLVTLTAQLEERYGDRLNFAEFAADLDLDSFIEMTAGRLVDYVVCCLHRTDSPRQSVLTHQER